MNRYIKQTARKWKYQRAFLVRGQVDDDLPLPKTTEQMVREEESRFEEIELDIRETFKLPTEATEVPQLTQLTENMKNPKVLPTFSQKLKGHLPGIMEGVLKLGKDYRDADVKFLSTMAGLATLMPNVVFFYDGHWYSPTLMLMVTGGPASGKSSSRVCRFVVKSVNQDKIAETRREYDALVRQGATPEQLKVVKRKLQVNPPDVTVAALVRILEDNDGVLLLETPEADVVSNSFRSEYGDYSTILRMAFEHQPIEVARASDPRPIIVERPRLSVVYAGTPDQIKRMIRSAEDGLFSRFVYYLLPPNYDYEVNLFEDEDGYNRKSEEEEFQTIGDKFYSLWLGVKDVERIQIVFPKALRLRLQRVMQVMQDACVAFKDEGVIGSLHRLGSYAFRIATGLTFMRRLENRNVEPVMECDCRDFNNALIIVKTLLLHCMKLYGGIIASASSQSLQLNAVGERADKQALFDALPATFTRQQFDEASKDIPQSPRTIEGWLYRWNKVGKVKQVAYATYQKVV